MPKVLLLAAAFATLGLAAHADIIDGAPPPEGSSCSGTCEQPGQGGWTTTVTASSTTTDTYRDAGEVYNQATLKSDGKASEKNRSDFQVITETVVTTTTTEVQLTNPGGNNPPPKEGTLTTVTWDSVTQTKTKVKSK